MQRGEPVADPPQAQNAIQKAPGERFLDNITQNPPPWQHFGEFYDDQLARNRTRHKFYHAASLNAVELTNSQFVLYSQIAIAANFGDRTADLSQRARLLRSWRTKRQIRRLLQGLERERHIERRGPRRYSLRGRVQWSQGARLRPISPHLLHMATDTTPALYARFMLLLASTRVKWRDITWQWVRRRLRCDTRTAQELYKAFCGVLKYSYKQEARRAVFWSRRPEWQRYVTRGGQVKYDCRPGAAHLVALAAAGARAGSGSENVPPAGARIGSIARGVLTRTAGLGPIGGELGGSGPGGPGAAGTRQRDRRTGGHIAAGIERRQRERRVSEQLDAISRCRQPAAKRGRLPAANFERDPGCRISFESMIERLPDGVKDQFKSEPAVRAELARRRTARGYRS